jgi:precorrin-6Y C5,15-methyltransferase (decarboxylating)
MTTRDSSIERRRPWLSIVGVSADGCDALSPRARAAVSEAAVVFGSWRQLALVRDLVLGRGEAWPSPFSEGLALLWARRGESTCVLASGDPFYFGVGATLAPRLAPDEFVCYPAPSSLSLAAAKLGWALQDTEVVSLHGRELSLLIPRLAPGRRVLALSWDERTPERVAQLLCERGFGSSRLHVLEELGGPSERSRSTSARDFAFSAIAKLNLIAIEVVAEPSAFSLPCRASLPDSAFEHDGQLTKRDVRALTLSALAPRAGETLWDVGAGAGSVAIEWLLSHPACQAYALERDAIRCERIARNARALGVPGLQVLQALAPDGLAQLPAPDAVFIGGGASDPRIFEVCHRALRPGGRLVINAVALETEALLLRWYAAHGGELCRLSVERAEPLGSMTGWLPARPVTQWRMIKS